MLAFKMPWWCDVYRTLYRTCTSHGATDAVRPIYYIRVAKRLPGIPYLKLKPPKHGATKHEPTIVR